MRRFSHGVVAVFFVLTLAAPVWSADTTYEVEAAFTVFTEAWLQKVESNMIGTRARPQIVQQGTEYTASYAVVLHEAVNRRIKQTDSPSAPYIGVFQYYEVHYESRGASRQSTLHGRYDKVKKVRVTEIFRYNNGQWTN